MVRWRPLKATPFPYRERLHIPGGPRPTYGDHGDPSSTVHQWLQGVALGVGLLLSCALLLGASASVASDIVGGKVEGQAPLGPLLRGVTLRSYYFLLIPQAILPSCVAIYAAWVTLKVFRSSA